jgi:hypothetical protein
MFINDVIVQRTLFSIIIDIIDDRGAEAVPAIVDKLKKFGFKYATSQEPPGVLMKWWCQRARVRSSSGSYC